MCHFCSFTVTNTPVNENQTFIIDLNDKRKYLSFEKINFIVLLNFKQSQTINANKEKKSYSEQQRQSSMLHGSISHPQS